MSDEKYFSGYTHAAVHETMIADQVRTNAYKQAICGNPHLFRDKIVLDIGCGTGILSLFCAQAGAAHVYAVDNSEIVQVTRVIVALNGYSSVISTFQGKIEDIILPSKVDIIVSEWMGFCLIGEQMLTSVLLGRDKWLKPGGLMFPDSASLSVFLLGEKALAEKEDFWKNVHGWDFSKMIDLVGSQGYNMKVNSLTILTTPFPVITLDLLTANSEQGKSLFGTAFKLTCLKDGKANCFGTFFDVGFTKGNAPVVLSTSPLQPATHWNQTCFYLKDSIKCKKGQVVYGSFEIRPENKHAVRVRTILDDKFAVNAIVG